MSGKIRLVVFCAFCLSAFPYTVAQSAKPDAQSYVRRNSFGIFGEYSNDSSHMLLGQAENRKLLTVGGSYAYRFVSSRYATVQYLAEVRPFILTSDPVAIDVVTVASLGPGVIAVANTPTPTPVSRCVAGVFTSQYNDPYSGQTYFYTDTVTCSRRWTFAQGLSPAGFKINFRPHHRIQPVVAGLAGYMFSTKPVPTNGAGSFNFTFELGGGVEAFQSHGRSMMLEYRYHHYSNKNSAGENPGVDNGLFKLTYTFGR
ncbi:MAG: acyloxyacyl hydrolase [Acidobacteriaceae bacterium]|nr:acyloxyacyl hydrolase [Acidobacteriaceae bacterium]